jgi:hypothetical protein
MLGNMRFAGLALAFAFLATGCGREESPRHDESAPVAEPAEEPAGETGRLSRYTRLDDFTLTRSAPEEAGFFEHECPGEGGFRLRHSESDLRENITVLAPGGGEHSLALPALANGAFSSTGETAEWRGDARADDFVPSALILRQSVVEYPDPAVPEVSYLVVVRLTPSPCVVARVPPGPDQNRLARGLADAPRGCLDESA